MDSVYALSHVADNELVAELARLELVGRRLTAKLLAHIAEVDARGLYREQACASMFEYCVRRLHLSEGAAYRRIHVARAARRLPVIFEWVAAGRVHLSGLSLLAPHLREENCEALLARAEHRSKREIQELVAELAPKPAVVERIRAVPRASAVDSPVEAAKTREHGPGHAEREDVDRPEPRPQPSTAVEPTRAPAPPRRPPIAPLAPGRFHIQLTADQALRDKIETAQKLLRHRDHAGKLDVVLDQALDLLIEKLMKDRFGVTTRPRKAAPPKPGSRHIPRAVKREVFRRDGDRCTFTDEHGHRCDARSFLELHHVVPFARGGPATVDNIVVLCRAHNALEAERDFGRAHVEQCIQQRLW